MSIRLLHGVHVPHRKNTAECVPTRMPPPAMVTIPMSMNIGRPATPVVKAGDVVKKAHEKGLVLITAGSNVIRFIPPLVIEKEHVDKMIEILKTCF